jgi:serine/threonine-protein kinase ATR
VLQPFVSGDSNASQPPTYLLLGVKTAVQHISSLLRILAFPIITTSEIPFFRTEITEHIPWILDSLMALRTVQGCWQIIVPSTVAILIEQTSNLLTVGLKNDNSVVQSKAYTILTLLSADLAQRPNEIMGTDEKSTQLRHAYCMALLQLVDAALMDRAFGRLATAKIVGELEFLSTQHHVLDKDGDFKQCVMLLKQASSVPLPVNFELPLSFMSRKLSCQAQIINERYQALSASQMTDRQPCLSEIEPNEILTKIFAALGRTLPDSKVSLETLTVEDISELPGDKQCIVIDLLSRLCCAAEGTLLYKRRGSKNKTLSCDFCGLGVQTGQKPVAGGIAIKKTVQELIADLIQTQAFLESRKPRIITMVILRRLVLHTNDTDFLDLERSIPGQWCLQSLQSSVRELRIAAGKAMALFLKDPIQAGIDKSLAIRNRQNGIAFLKSLSEKTLLHLNESLVMAWARLGHVVTQNELNLVLVKLLEYLGSSNNLVSSFAFNEILNLAVSWKTTARGLFEPFWGSIAFFAVKDMVSRPQITRAIADLLQITVHELLLLIQTHALPWLVLNKKKDVILKIMEARQDKEIFHTLMDGANMSPILSLLLIQDVPDVLQFTKLRLVDISPHFEPLQLSSIILSEHSHVALELLKAAGDSDETRRPRVSSSC